MLAKYAQKPDWYARSYTVVCSSCHHNLQCGNFKLFFAVVCFVLFYVVLLFVVVVVLFCFFAEDCTELF